MAATRLTPSAIYRENLGSLTLIVADFAATTDWENEWNSNIGGIFKFWAQGTDSVSSQTKQGVGVTESGGVFAFYPGEDDSALSLFVLARN